jgi:uncharacterized OB-fold protein
MWKCANCGTENRDDRNYCWSCVVGKGTSNPENSPVPQKAETSSQGQTEKQAAPSPNLDTATKRSPLPSEQEIREWEKLITKSAIALINCPACNSEVSNQAIACPKCGHPIKDPEPVQVSKSNTFTPVTKGNSSSSRSPILSWAVIGFLVGGCIGFQLRPSVPLVGQLPFDVVISQGSNLRGADHLLIPFAQASFNEMLTGAILGAIIGIIIGAVRSKKNLEKH